MLQAPAVDRYLLPAGCSAANPLVAIAAVDQWDIREKDREMDARPFHRPCCSDCTGKIKNNKIKTEANY